MFATAESFQDIIVRLSVLRYVITANTKNQKYDLATDAEDFFAGFLNRLMGWQLVNLNREKYKNYPAIDLGDEKRRIAVQVTAENKVDKIRETLTKFHDNSFQTDYDLLIILILSRKLDYSTNIQSLKRDLAQLIVWDIDDLLSEVERRLKLDDLHDQPDNLAETLENYTRTQLPSIVRALSAGEKRNGLLHELELVVGHPPASAQGFLDWCYQGQACPEAYAAFLEIMQFYLELKDRSYTPHRYFLVHAIRKSVSGKAFTARYPQYGGQVIYPDMLLFQPWLVAHMFTGYPAENYQQRADALQALGWARPIEDWPAVLSLGVYMKSLDANFLSLLWEFLQGDAQKLHEVLVDLDFRHLDAPFVPSPVRLHKGLGLNH